MVPVDRVCSSTRRSLFGSLVLLSVLSGICASSRAEQAALSGTAIEKAVTGATVHLDTPLGVALPLVFHTDGTVSGTAGRLAFYLGSAADRGTWWVANGRLCQRWKRWFDGETSCIQIFKSGPKFAWQRDDGKSGTARIVSLPSARPAEAQQIASPSIGASPMGQPIIVPPVPVLVAERSGGAGLASENSANHRGPQRAVPVTGNVAQPPAVKIESNRRVFRVVGVQSHDILNLRARPDTEASIVGTAPAAARGLTALGRCQRAWCLVRYGRSAGWANTAFLAPESAPTIGLSDRRR
jgi:hypothetical protein